MSLIHLDGFDEYAQNSDMGFYYTNPDNWNVDTTGGRYGGGSFYMSGGGEGFGYPMPAAQTEVWIGFAMACNNGATDGTNRAVLSFFSAAGLEASIFYCSQTSTWTCYRGNTNTLLGSGYGNFGNATVWHWVEFHYKISATAGVMEVWVDGVQVVDVTGADTTQNSSTQFTLIDWGYNGNQGSCSSYIDDSYVLNTSGSANNTRLGDSRIESLKPTSDAGPNNGTCSSGSAHYAMVDENQNDGSTTTITIANTSGQEELFGMASLAGTPATVHAVKVLNIVQKTDGGACNGEAVVSSGGTPAEGSSTSLLTTFSPCLGIFETDPNTSAAWAYTAVNAMECGFQIP
jgi:hypothetical protein